MKAQVVSHMSHIRVPFSRFARDLGVGARGVSGWTHVVGWTRFVIGDRL